MSIKETLTESKNKLDALLDFANNTTGNSDTNIGDAIKTLADGFGQGGGEVESGTITIEKLSSNFTLPTTKQHEIYIFSVENPKEFVATEGWTVYFGVVWVGYFSLIGKKYTSGLSSSEEFIPYTINDDNSITISAKVQYLRAGTAFNWKAF